MSMENSVVDTGRSRSGVRHFNPATKRYFDYVFAARLRMACPGLFPPPRQQAAALAPVAPQDSATIGELADGPRRATPADRHELVAVHSAPLVRVVERGPIDDHVELLLADS